MLSIKIVPRCHGQQPVQSTPVPTNPPPSPPPQVPNHYSRFCPHCGAGMSAFMQICPSCHKSNTSPAVPQQPSSKAPLYIALSGVAGLAGIFLFNNVFSVANSSGNTNSSSNSPSPTAIAKPVFAPPIVVPTATVIPTAVPTPNSRPLQNRVAEPRQPRVVKTTPTRLVEVLSGQIREAASVEDLEDIRSIVARLRLDFSMSEQDLNERGYYFDSTMGPGLMKGVMDSLWDAIDQKRLALRNETGMGNVYLQSCESQLMTAGIQASQVKGTVTLNLP